MSKPKTKLNSYAKIKKKSRQVAVCLLLKRMKFFKVTISDKKFQLIVTVSFLHKREREAVTYLHGMCMSTITHIHLTNHFPLYHDELCILPLFLSNWP